MCIRDRYIAFDDPSDIEDIEEIGNKLLVDRFIIKKILPYYSLAGWNVQPLENAKNGLSDVNWL